MTHSKTNIACIYNVHTTITKKHRFFQILFNKKYYLQLIEPVYYSANSVLVLLIKYLSNDVPKNLLKFLKNSYTDCLHVVCQQASLWMDVDLSWFLSEIFTTVFSHKMIIFFSMVWVLCRVIARSFPALTADRTIDPLS